jgi:hypothetical protein
MDDMIASIHESTHCCFNHHTGRGVFSVEIDGRGGGESSRLIALWGDRGLAARNGRSKCRPALRANWNGANCWSECSRRKSRSADTARPLALCWHDIATVNRVLSSISESTTEERDMRREVERRARRFVMLRWPYILRLARALYRRGKLDRYEIEDVLSPVAPAKLNEVGAKNCADLISAGCVSFSPFAWDSDENAEELYLGISDDDTIGPKLVYPFGKNNQVYIEALHAAKDAGGTVGAFASKLLADIEKMQKQSLENTPRPRAHPIEEGFRWRTDGYLKPFV